MANQLKIAMVNAILTLKQRGLSGRRIACELGIDRETVAGYVDRPGADANLPDLPEELQTLVAQRAIRPLGRLMPWNYGDALGKTQVICTRTHQTA